MKPKETEDAEVAAAAKAGADKAEEELKFKEGLHTATPGTQEEQRADGIAIREEPGGENSPIGTGEEPVGATDKGTTDEAEEKLGAA